MLTSEHVRQWIISCNGVEQMVLKPGDAVQIGRRPIRALPDQGMPRLEIADDSRSMSKRHATVRVNEHGEAVVRDLHSTNGTYMLGSSNTLMRLSADVEFTLPTSPVRLQFGDAIALDFVQVDTVQDDTSDHVPNLFTYAGQDYHNFELNTHMDPQSMSVNDILQVRQGEPTSVFAVQPSRSSSTSSLQGLEGLSAGSQLAEHEQAQEGLVDQVAAQFDDLAQSADDVTPDQSDLSPQSAVLNPEVLNIAVQSLQESLSREEKFEHPVERLSVNVFEEVDPNQVPQLDLFSDAQDFSAQATQRESTPASAEADLNQEAQQSDAGQQETEQQEAGQQEAAKAECAENADDASRRNIADSSADDIGTAAVVDDAITAVAVAAAEHVATPTQAAQYLAYQPDQAHASFMPGHHESHDLQRTDHHEVIDALDEQLALSDTSRFEPQTPSGLKPVKSDNDAAAEDNLTEGSTAEDAAATSYEPAFEPGSVFARVREAQHQAEQEVVVQGWSATTARTSSDYAQQFEMSQHQELLPYLAMNPHLYDDLYAWLAALGIESVDAALQHNRGFEQFQSAMGK